MAVNNPQSVDISYKFMYKMLGIDFHQYLYDYGETIEFIETEVSGSGLRKDITAKIDGDTIQITEFMSTPLYDGKLRDMYKYHQSTRDDPAYEDFDVKTAVFSIANPNHGKNETDIDDNIRFHVETTFTQDRNGWEVLSSLENKISKREELTGDDAIDLLILPDMDIDMPIKELMSRIIVLIGKAKLPDDAFKEKIILCEVKVLNRFFNDNELSEMIEMLKAKTKNPEVERVIEKYGLGFDVIFFDGKAKGFDEGFDEGFDDGVSKRNHEIAKNLIAEGCDEEFISRSTSLSINEIRKLKRKL